MTTPPRIYVPYSNVAVIYFDDLRAKVDVFWDEDLVRIKMPGLPMGGVKRPLSEYDAFEGGMHEWLLSMRAELEEIHQQEIETLRLRLENERSIKTLLEVQRRELVEHDYTETTADGE